MNQRPNRSSFKNLNKDNNITTNTGFTLALQQYKALLKKNFLLTRRNKWPTIFQFLQQILIICAVQGAVYYTKVTFDKLPLYQTITNPPLKPSPSIPPCEVKSFVKLPCYDFVWSGDQNPVIREIVLRIMKNNPGREIPNSKVISFRNKEDVDDWLYKNPMYTSGALHFVQKNDSVISYGIQTNSTSSGIEYRGRYEDPTFKFQLPLQFAAEREIARYLLRDPSFSWNVFLEEYPHQGLVMDLPVFEIVSPMLFLFTAFIFFISQITSLVTEKELKLRQAMTGMGLYDSAYWLSWLTWEAFMTLISSLLIIFCGMMFRFPFFLKNSFAIVFFLFFLFQLNLTAMAFMLSTFFSKSSSTSTVGFCIQLVAVLTQVLTLGEYPYSYGTKKMMLQNIWSLFPPNPFTRALSILLEAVQTPEDKGVSWSKRGTCGVDIDDKDCRMTINDCFIWLLATFVLWFVLAMYFDNIMPNAMGVRKSMLYFLSPGYWTGNGGQQLKEGSIFSFLMPTQHEGQHSTPDDEDVLEEENVVKQQQTHNSTDSNVAVQLLGIRKSYPGTFSIGNKLKRTSPYHAVKGLWVNFPKDQLFCLLGPNGAGKTTVISCLTGISPVTDGDALIYGHSIRSAAGMANIRKLIGVCPQFDILWDKLSGTEHLHLFGSIKGLSPATIKMITPASLAEVKLTDVANVRSGSYSGGMKRRLSVAIALIGDPKLVILDEPTTGMDPITRRHVWDIIENAKKGRAIVLTTHSMEEADILSDRIGIMAKGRMRCIGTSIRLKSRFGTGFVANINFRENNPEHCAAVKQFFKNHLDVVPKEENSIFLTFVIPHEKEALLSDFFSKLEEREEEFGISDIQLGLATLEEVFLNIAKQAELETAVAEGRLVTLTLSSGEPVEIPVGARFVGIPGTGSGENSTGFMVEVYWDQDDTGTLCIAGHSQKAPIPEGVQLSSSTAATQQRSAGEPGTIYGVVIDPSLVSSENFQ